MDKLYFAYGAGMNRKGTRERCPNAREVGRTVLRGCKVVERKYADIDQSSGSTVDGLVWSVTDSDLEQLDKYEGCPSCYIRHQVVVEFLRDSTELKCFVYEMTAKKRLSVMEFHIMSTIVSGVARVPWNTQSPLSFKSFHRFHQFSPLHHSSTTRQRQNRQGTIFLLHGKIL
jgi:gamma-glutamylcyclotransferase (GGCT)/AIG2-like uncharacterized protein YtfP